VKVAHVSQTPVAGAAWAWSEAFKEAGYESFCVAKGSYQDGRRHPSDANYPPDTETIERITECDVLFCHQGKPYRAEWWPRQKPTIGIYHSQPTANHTDRLLERDGWPWAAIGQWEERLFTEADGVDAWPVPNLVPLDHPWFQLSEKPLGRVVIAYSPSNRTMTGWDNKGFEQTAGILGGLGAEVDIITGTPLETCLRRKARAHIIIDECITGAYHRSSLEGLALGCIVVNNCDAQCAWLIRRMTGGCNHPFVRCGIGELEAMLRWLIEKGPNRLKGAGLLNRKWMQGAWEPADLIRRNFEPLIEAAIENAA